MLDFRHFLAAPAILALSLAAGADALAQQPSGEAPSAGVCGQPLALNAAQMSFDAQPTQVVGAFVQLVRNEPRYVELTVSVPVALTLATDTSQADTTLMLFDDTGAMLASDDDGAGDTNARIVTALQPGRYCLQVDRIGALDASSAVVPVSVVGAPSPDACISQADAPIRMGADSDEIISSGQLKDKTRMAIELAAGTGLRIEASSPIFDTFLTVEDQVGRIVGEDDDGGGGTDSMLELPAFDKDGTYCVTLSGLDDQAGLYALAISPIRPE